MSRRPLDAGRTCGPAQERGAGWANVAVPAAPLGLDKATVDARVDPNADQGRLSTALSRSVPIGGGVSVTLQNGYAVTQSLANSGGVATHVYSGDGDGAARASERDRAVGRGDGCPRRMNDLPALGERRAKTVRLAAERHRHDQRTPDRRDRPQHHGGVQEELVKSAS